MDAKQKALFASNDFNLTRQERMLARMLYLELDYRIFKMSEQGDYLVGVCLLAKDRDGISSILSSLKRKGLVEPFYNERGERELGSWELTCAGFRAACEAVDFSVSQASFSFDSGHDAIEDYAEDEELDATEDNGIEDEDCSQYNKCMEVYHNCMDAARKSLETAMSILSSL